MASETPLPVNDTEISCPWCGSANTWAEFVDIGVGEQQVTPYECGDCFARQIDSYLEHEHELTEGEKRRGWWNGAECRHEDCGTHPDLARACFVRNANA